MRESRISSADSDDLRRRLDIEAQGGQSAKPVYDGETADVDAVEQGMASLPAAAPTLSLSDYVAVAAVVVRTPVGAHAGWSGDLRARQMARHRAAPLGRAAARDSLDGVRERDPLYAREGSAIPA